MDAYWYRKSSHKKFNIIGHIMLKFNVNLILNNKQILNLAKMDLATGKIVSKLGNENKILIIFCYRILYIQTKDIIQK